MLDAAAQADHLLDHLQMAVEGAEGAAEHPVRRALLHQHRRDQRAVAPELRGGIVAPQPAPLAEAVVILGRPLQHRFVVEAREVIMAPGLQPQAEVGHLAGDHLGAADEDRPGQILVNRDLHRAQHPVVLALGIGDALGPA